MALAVGIVLAACGIVLWAQAERFAPNWQSPEQAVLGGITGLKANRFYENIGIVVLTFGASLCAAAAGNGFSEFRRRRRAAKRVRTPPSFRA
jgi:hypothetical protein